MDYNAIRNKVNELNRTAVDVVDRLKPLEDGSLFNVPLTQIQIGDLTTMLKSKADNLKTIAGEIKLLVS